MKRVVVISLGGSLIIPKDIDIKFLEKFKEVIIKNKKRYKFIIVCGGGFPARTYINGLKNQPIKEKEYFQNLLGISITRINARFLSYFFGKDANQGIPHEIKEIRNLLLKHDIVFCGALRYEKRQTSDSTAAKLAKAFNSDFINMTNIYGLYDKNPKTHSSAKFIPEISHADFLKKASKLKFTPGQHFVLDQSAAKIIKKYEIRTFIIGENTENLDNLINKKHFIGTIIDKK